MGAMYQPSHLPSLLHCEKQSSFRYRNIFILEDRVSKCSTLHRLIMSIWLKELIDNSITVTRKIYQLDDVTD